MLHTQHTISIIAGTAGVGIRRILILFLGAHELLFLCICFVHTRIYIWVDFCVNLVATILLLHAFDNIAFLSNLLVFSDKILRNTIALLLGCTWKCRALHIDLYVTPRAIEGKLTL